MIKEVIPHFDQMSDAEKLLLLEELWDDLSSRSAQIPIPEWQQKELDRRYAEYLRNPEESSPWAEVQERLLGKLQ